MKLDSPSRFTSFYESFSDLIFATMAIFVLLMIVFLTLVKPPGDKNIKQKLQQAETQIVKQSERLSKAEFERDKSREQLQQLTAQLSKLKDSIKTQGLQLVVAVDVSGSMGEALGHLVETITTISKVIPKITSNFSIGVVAYRKGEYDSSPLQLFPLQKIRVESRDGGRSFKKISDFLNGLKATNGIAPIGLAVNKAIDFLDSSTGGDGYQIFLLLGDVGPYEYSLSDLYFNSDKQRNEVAIKNRIASWVNGAEKRRVISLFSGVRPQSNYQDYQQYLIRYEQSLRFFREVVEVIDQPENFTQNPGKMLAYLLTAIVKGK